MNRIKRKNREWAHTWANLMPSMPAMSQPTQQTVAVEIPSANDKRASLIRAFFARYSFKLDLMNQPSEQTLAILIKLHQGKSAEFVPMSKVSNFFDNKEIRIEPTRIQGTPLLIDPQGLNQKNKATFNISPENFTHCVRVLMLGYVLVSANDPPNDQWCTLEAAMAHIDSVEHYSRMDSGVNHALHSRIMQAEMTIRTEWARVCQYDPKFSLGDAINLIGRRHQLWPCVTEFRTVNVPLYGPRGDKGEQNNVVVNQSW